MAAMTQEPTSSPTCLPLANSWSWKTSSSPRAKGELGSRWLLAAIGQKGLNTTWKVRDLALWVLGSEPWEAAAIAAPLARASTRAVAAPVRATFRMIPLLATRPRCLVRLCCPAALEEGKR
jgi:hypothetical protein